LFIHFHTMRLLTGDECGLIKETIPEVGRPARKDAGPTNSSDHQITVDKGVQRIDGSKQTRSRAITAMAWIDTSGKFAALRANSSIEVWEGIYADGLKKPGTYNLIHTVENVFDSKSGGRPLLALGYSNERLCAADSLGNVAIVNPDKAAVVATYSAYSSSKQGATITYTKGNVVNTQLATALATSSCGQIAVGGRERETTILDINNGAQVWKAKNLPPDAQTLLQQPVWSTSLTFMNSTLLLAGTAYKQVRLYDIRSNSRRPVSYTPEGLLEHRVTALCGIDEQSYVVGDAAGYLSEVDMRMAMGKSKKSSVITIPRFVGPVGSIRQIVRHHTKPLIACVGLDRMLRTYSTKTRRHIDCVYLKQRLNCVLFCDDDEWESKKDEISYDDVEDKDMDAEDDVQDYVISDEEGESDLDNDDDNLDDDEGEEDESDEDNEEGDESDDDSQNGDDSVDGQPENEESIDSGTGPFIQSKKKRRR
jgi:ribosome biogenesis protein NSA1